MLAQSIGPSSSSEPGGGRGRFFVKSMKSIRENTWEFRLRVSLFTIAFEDSSSKSIAADFPAQTAPIRYFSPKQSCGGGARVSSTRKDWGLKRRSRAKAASEERAAEETAAATLLGMNVYSWGRRARYRMAGSDGLRRLDGGEEGECEGGKGGKSQKKSC